MINYPQGSNGLYSPYQQQGLYPGNAATYSGATGYTPGVNGVGPVALDTVQMPGLNGLGTTGSGTTGSSSAG